MPEVFFGLFKKVGEAVISMLSAQLSSGPTFFDYNLVGTDATVYDSRNNIYGNNSTTNNGTLIKSTTWIEPVTKRPVTTCFKYGESYDQPPAAEPLLAIEAHTVTPFVLVNRSFVARIPYIKNSMFSGAHIQNINNVDHIVAYELDSALGGFTIRKYKAVLDEALDQENIPYMALDPDKEITYTEIVDGVNQLVRAGNVTSIFFYPTTYELTEYWPQQNRTLVCNADGSKTVFFAKRKDVNGDYTHHVIFELTDTELEFTLTEVDVFVQQIDTLTIGADAIRSVTGSEFQILETEINGCTADTVFESGADNTLSTANCSYSFTFFGDTRINTYFMGVAYDRRTDQRLIMSVEKKEFTGTSGYPMGTGVQNTYAGPSSWDATWETIGGFGPGYVVRFNDTEIDFKAEGYNRHSTSGGYCEEKTVTDFNIAVVDLASTVIMSELLVQEDLNTVREVSKTGYIYVNGVLTEIDKTVETSSIVKTVSLQECNGPLYGKDDSGICYGRIDSYAGRTTGEVWVCP